MKTNFKRLLSVILVLVMVCSMLPLSFMVGAAEPEDIVLTDEDYAIVNDVFAQIDKMEDAPAKKSASRTQITDAAAEIVMASENYVEGSLERNGNSFTWWTDEGIRCIYNPYMREKYDRMEAPANAEPAGIYNAPKATKGGWPSGNQVYLIAPYYGLDDTFTDQYKNEAKSIATAIGDTDGYTLCSGKSVTVDTVADAIESGAVVIFDSHGTTDYDGAYVGLDPDGYEVYDYVSKAKYSYLCLTSKTGLTSADYTAGATYFTDSEGLMCCCINGAAIANHMDKNSPAGFLWMAICLGMATNTMCEPMRAKGVEVVYGYSQSVTFAGDYCFEETFWDNMIAGKTVAQSVSAMKNKWGNWDWSEPIAASYGWAGSGYTLTQARQYRSAFPIVVSDEDTHPGQRGNGSTYGADSEQTVKSTYTLYNQYNVTAQSNNTAWGSVSVNGSTITATPATGYFAQSATVVSGTATVTQNGNTFSVMAESDCTVQINFAAKTAVTVSFSGANVAGKTGYAGDSMSLPTVTAPEGYKFLGWMTAPLSGATTEKPSFYTDSFVPTGNTTLYALYSYVDSTSGGGSGDYVKVTETPDDWSGEYLIVYEAGSRVFDGSLTTLEAVSNYQDVTISDNTISAEEADAYKFVIAAMDGGYSIQSASGKYISGTASSNKLNAGTSPAANKITIDANGNADIVSNTSHLRYNATSGQDRFRYYKSTSYSSQKAIALYVKDGSAGTTYYTTSLCDHEKFSAVAAVAPTCTEIGYTAGIRCDDCGSILSGCEEVAALGHTMDGGKVTTEATCTADGMKTFACSACGETVTETIPATGHSYVQSGMTFTCSSCGDTYTAAASETLQYVFSNYTAGTQYAEGEDHELDETVTLTINGAHLNTQIRLYAGSNAVFSSEKYVESIIVKAGYKVGTLNVWASENGSTWELIAGQATTTSYTNYSFVMPANTKYVMLESVGAQIRVTEMSITVSEIGGSTEPEVTEPEVTEPEATEPIVTEPSGDATGVQMVTNPVAGTAYKLYLEQTTLEQTLYFAGTVANKDYYLATTEDVNAAVDVYLESADGGYYLYFMADGVKTYIDMYQSGTYYNLRLAASASAVYTYDSTYNTLIAMNGDTNCFIGTYNTYNTMSCCKESYLSGNFVSHLGIPANAPVEPDPSEPTEPEITEPEVTEPVGSSATIDFSSTAQRTSFDVNAQVWENEGATLTNNKGNSSSDVADYSNPARFYKNSDVIITFPGMTKIEFVCTSDTYATALLNSLADADASVDGQVVTVSFADAVDEFSFTLTGGQVRVSKLTVYAGSEECQHNYVGIDTPPTCTEQGYTTYACIHCGEVDEVTDYVDALGHSYADGICGTCGAADPDYVPPVVLPSGDATLKFSNVDLTLASDLTITFKVKGAVFGKNAYSNPRVEYRIPDTKNNKVISEEITEFTTDTSGRLIVPIKGISPRLMKAPITIILYGTYQGVEYSFEYGYAVTNYCYSQLRKSSSSALLKTLVVDLLNFGTAHQKYAGHEVDNLINADLSDTEKTLGSNYELKLEDLQDAYYVVREDATAVFKGVTLVLQEAVVVRLKVECTDLNDAFVRFTLAGKNFDIPSSEWEPVAGEANRYYVYFNSIRASEMGKEILATVNRGDAIISNTLRYSIETYAAKNIDKAGNSQALKDLMAAMMYYGKSCDAYF